MKTCKIENCRNKYYAKDYCKKHYLRIWRYGHPSIIKQERHGMCGTQEYKAWQCMKERCYKAKNNRYHCYGGRGITVCKRWRNSFKAFLKDMGLKPFPKAQIDRKDNDKGYFPENCHWTSSANNNRNRSNNKLNINKANKIREEYKKNNISQRKLALIYGISQRMVGHIIHERSWIKGII